MRAVFNFILYLITFALTVGINLQRLKDQVYEYHTARRLQAWKQCSANPQSPVTAALHNAAVTGPKVANLQKRNRRDVSSRDVAVLLDGNIGRLTRENEKLELDDVPAKDFTIELWLKPEGGQQNPAIILKAENLCSTFPSKGWELGIKVMQYYKKRNARLYFSMETVQNHQPTVLFAPFNYKPGKWVYVLVSYDRNTLILYINGAQVAVSRVQKGDVFITDRTCSLLHLGGYRNSYIRGTIDKLRIWNHSVFPGNVKKYMKGHTNSEYEKLLFDEFDSLDQWIWNNTFNIEKSNPKLVASDIPTNPLSFQFMPSICGFTLCDDPEIVRSYQSSWELRRPKKIRYRIINVRNSDGSNPTVTDQQIINQHRALQSAFLPYNITWELYKESIYNTSLRSHTIMFGCNPQNIGNGQCDPECQFTVTGNDGGDCNKEEIKCTKQQLENGICNPECNQAYNNWDNGDCCKEKQLNNCIDPSSPNRIYLDIEEYKSLLNFNNSKYLNILFANWTNKDILGIATFPWEKEVYSEYGGVVVKPDEFGRKGKLDTLIHELGHVLGLWHVHHGISEVDCHDPCFEREASMDVGDLCEDTNPTPSNEKCYDPPHKIDRCGISKFVNTPFKNYMSYTDCASSFSAQQAARMHCYIDLQYQRWNENFYILPPPPLSPKIVSSSQSSLTLAWIPPLSRILENNFDCSKCTKDLELIQFAQKAEASSSFPDFWLPSQATGPPDAQICVIDDKVWIPYSHNRYEDYELILSFEYPVIPSLLSIWITWKAKHDLKEIEIIFTDGSNIILTDIHTYCDIPYTIPLFVNKELSKVRLTGSFLFGVDSMQVISTANNNYCTRCKPMHYRISRTPEFPMGLRQEVDSSEFTDNDVKFGEAYTYTVQALIPNYSSHMSSPLRITHGDNFCGDGKINGQEQCDDGNIANNDGCNMNCEMEESYMCYGEPSLCYWHKGDGKCEDYEIKTSVTDCGYYTPDQFEDQWAMSVNTSQLSISDFCSKDIVIGPPIKPEICEPEPNSNISWYPCDNFSETNYWLTASFSKPVVATSVFLYIGSDGQSTLISNSNQISIHLLDSNNNVHYSAETVISCSQNPIEFRIVHDLSRQFYLTSKINITFESSDISISAILLRSAKYLNPIIIRQCKETELYSPKLQKCVMYSNCKKPACSKPLSKNYQLNCTGYKEGDYCYVNCNSGYYSEKTKTNVITCIDGKWIGPEILCKPIDCGPPTIMHAFTICPEGTTLGKTCNFKCKSPARLKGDITANTITCEEDGFWSIPDTPCQILCPPLQLLPSIIYSKTQCQMYSFQTGHRCYFQCKSGYHIIGQPKKKKFYAVCDAHGSWQGPQCIPITEN
ncbi:pappalysin-1-like [Centruroides vittatus]|uniref:pappalysin-1-like n=1 Tax=Centruroides vittatus TaxID=120091 RepID=UPI003510845E